MANKSGFDKARASVLKSLRNLEETVTGMVGFDEGKKKTTKKKAKRKTKKARR